MVKVSNNLLAALLMVAIIITGAGVFTAVTLTKPKLIIGAATSATGLTNLSITSTYSIKMLRNVTDFGAGTIASGQKYTMASNQTNPNPTPGSASFFNGTEGNNSASGNCDYAVGTGGFPNCTYPFVIENDGNNNATCVELNGTDAQTFLGTSSGSPEFYAAERDNETAAGPSCGGNKAYTWMPVNTSSNVILCQQLHSDDTIDSIRIHFYIGLPDSTPVGAKSNLITITALNAC